MALYPDENIGTGLSKEVIVAGGALFTRAEDDVKLFEKMEQDLMAA